MGGETNSKNIAEVYSRLSYTQVSSVNVVELYCTYQFILYIKYVDVISQKGLSNVTVDGLIQEITPKARGIRDHICHFLCVHVPI